MISVTEASHIFQKHLKLKPLGLAQSIKADRDYPPFNRVMMDGIAIRLIDYKNGIREFKVTGIQAAGEVSKELKGEGNCLEVMTGASLPCGADLVIPYEHITLSDGLAKVIQESERKNLDNVHLKGSDCLAGEIVLNETATLTGPHQGISASMGQEFKLHPGNRILLISTGLELVEISQKPLEHQIRRSNVYALKTSLELHGFQLIDMDHLPDDPIAIADHFKEVVSQYDILIYSGGVSKGKFDFLPQVWKDSGVQCHFHEVSQRPGKPLWFGSEENFKTIVVGLPGNPVSSLVCLHRYLLDSCPIFVKLAEDIVFKKNLTYFLPAKIETRRDGCLWATPSEIKNSGEFTALAHTHGFLELPSDINYFEKGQIYTFWTWRPFL